MTHRSRIAVLLAVASALAACGPDEPRQPPVPRIVSEIRLDGAAIAAELATAMMSAGVVPSGTTPDVRILTDPGSGIRRFDGARLSWEQSGFRVEGKLTADEVAERIRGSLAARGLLPEEGRHASTEFLRDGEIALRYTQRLGHPPEADLANDR